MKKSRKTCDVVSLVNYANNLLAQTESPYPEYLSAEYKYGICEMLEKVLHISGNYRGYIFLYPDKVDGMTSIDYKNPYEFTRKYLLDKNKHHDSITNK
jgi:hypothetical protein